MIIVHIGLPKTGTTLLQHHIFQKTFKNRFHHWQASENVRRMRDICQKRDSDQKNRETLVEWLKKRKDGPPSMISCENIASQSGGFWNGSGPSPSEVAKFLHGIRDAASVEPNDFKILVGVRRSGPDVGIAVL